MRKFTILFLIFAFSMMSFITGCSDDESGGTTGPSIDPEDYDYYMLVSATGNQRSDYIITITPMNDNVIISVEISINGIDVVMSSYMDMWSGYTNMEEGQTYQVEAVINGTDHSLTINTPYIPIVDWPTNWNITEPTIISWTLTSNAEYQEFYATATDYITWDENYADLDPSDRSFTIPGNWVDPLLTDYYLMLIEMNFSFEDNLIVSCMSANEAGYGILREMSVNDKIKISQNIFERFLK
ncbi:MAG: hypothetical protein U9P73_10635 [Candidatus Cloacimonadota bacterium]|nr:hypothetical protein [Candidatus Cloacimonadota bacterium]